MRPMPGLIALRTTSQTVIKASFSISQLSRGLVLQILCNYSLFLTSVWSTYVIVLSQKKCVASILQERRKGPLKGSDTKRTRRDRGEMEDIMFKLFERQANWTLKQLISETNQPEVCYFCLFFLYPKQINSQNDCLFGRGNNCYFLFNE